MFTQRPGHTSATYVVVAGLAILLAGYAVLAQQGVLPSPVPPKPGTETGSTQPGWLQQLIAEQERDQVASPPALIERCEYNGKVVYFLPQRCCDAFSNLYSSTGEVMCHPDGGISGRGDGQCGDFMATKKNCQLIWKDSRQ